MWLIFEEYISNMVQFLADESNRCSSIDKNNTDFNTDIVKIIISLIFLSGYNNCLSEGDRDYWSNNPYSRCDAFCEKHSKLIF